jgi:intracellular septation protein
VKEKSLASKPAPKWLKFALDFGPVLVFFLAYKLGSNDAKPVQGAMFGTSAFMVAILIAVLVSKWKLGKIAPMLWVSAILIVGFGGLTLFFQDFKFIQHKATAVWGLFAAVLLGGWLFKKPLVKYVFEHAFDGVDEAGWMKLTLRWGVFFLFLGLLNEAMIILLSESNYVTAKTFAVLPLFFVFTLLQIPMLIRHGLNLEDEDAAEK